MGEEMNEEYELDYMDFGRSKPCPACSFPMEPDEIMCAECLESEVLD